MSATTSVPQGLETLAFLVGVWRGRGEGHYPTMDPFEFEEEIRFSHVGAPILIYSQWAWVPAAGDPLHLETGVWRPTGPDTLAVTVSLPRVAEVSEGTVHGTSIRLESTSMARAAGGAPLVRATRSYDVDGDRLVYDVEMATDEVDLTHHIHAELARVASGVTATRR